MIKEFLHQIPKEFIYFMLTVLFSLLIGLEQRRRHNDQETNQSFGTDRTFTLIGILGYVLYILSPVNLIPFLIGLALMVLFLGIYYFKKITNYNRYGLTAIITSLVTYCIAPLIYTQPQYLVLLIVVCLLIVTEIKADLSKFSKKFDNNEFITLAKFLIVGGIILPLLPKEPIVPNLSITAYNFWLSIVVVSGISYFSYLLQKFIFPNSGILLTGLLGGLYSSTATTIILARKSKGSIGNNKIVPAMMLSLAMMYFRIILLAFLFNKNIALLLLPYISILLIISLLLAFFIMQFQHKITGVITENTTLPKTQNNPLEFKTALVFGLLFVVFTLLTHYVLKNFGSSGLHSIALIAGVADIDPFILNLLQGNWTIKPTLIVAAILLAVNSNNIAKMALALFICDRSLLKPLLLSFSSIIITGFLLYFLHPFS